MKKLVRAVLTIAIPSIVFVAPSVHAATSQLLFTQSTGAPISGTPTYKAGDTAYFVISNFPSSPAEGVYAYQAVQPAAGAKPTQSNTQGAVWISTQAGATFAPTAIIALKLDNGNAWGADCAHQQCGIFIDGAHGTTSPAQQFVAFNFEAAPTPAASPAASPTPSASPSPTPVALPKDSLSVLLNGTPVAPNGLSAIGYRETVKFTVTSAASAAISFKSYTPNLCPVTASGEVTALKGTGQCDIAVIAASTATTSATEIHFPFNLGLGKQELANPSFTVKVGQSVSLATISNFGEKVTYKIAATKSCTLKGSTLKAVKVGACNLTATAPGSTNYPAFTGKVLVTVKK